MRFDGDFVDVWRCAAATQVKSVERDLKESETTNALFRIKLKKN